MLCALGLALALGVVSSGGAGTAAPAGVTVDVMAFNVLLRGGSPLKTVQTIRDADADVLFLQEVTPAWQTRLESAFARRYPHRRYLARAGAYGYAILSKHPLGALSIIRVDGGPPAAVCAVGVVGGAGRVALCSLHLKSARSAFHEDRQRLFSALEENERLRAHQWRAVLRWLDEHAGDVPHVLAGDTNTPDFDPFASALTEQHVDAARRVSLMPAPTYPALPPGAWLKMRLDYVLVSPSIGVVSCAVLDGGGSDHFPVVARLTLPRAE